MTDPYVHHPELRGKIDDPDASFLRTLTIDLLERLALEHGLPTGWWYPDDVREGLRRAAMAGRWDRDLWVFAYGSLMWDPGIRFAEVRRAHLDGYERRFILKEATGGRGTEEAPGLFAALDVGTGCDGLVFRIERERLEEETRILWQREQIAPGYIPHALPVATAAGEVEALAFVADHAVEVIEPDIPRETQVRYMATGAGIVGSSRDYLCNIVQKLDELGIEDPETRALFADVEAYEVS